MSASQPSSRFALPSHLPIRIAIVSVALMLAACGGGSGGPSSPAAPPPPAPPGPSLSPEAQVGALLFTDKILSGAGRMSCVACHDPAAFDGPPNALPVQPGGALQSEFGRRAAPSIRYLERQAAFSWDGVNAASARGGFTSDGRVNTLAEQAHLPLFSPIEMDNLNLEGLAARVRASKSGPLFNQVFGTAGSAAQTVAQIEFALQAFQRENPAFHPYDSKFDAVASGRERFTVAEARGLAAFNDPLRGNCAACHTSTVGADGKPPLFTNFSYAATGVPRNSAIPANADANYFDLGLCGPLRQDLARPELCGLFRVPSLRNTTKRPVFFHNGVMNSLEQVLRFYNSRETQPERWYPLENGQPKKYDDLPTIYHANISKTAPMDERPLGGTPAMSEQDIADILCFLGTLSDGYVTGTPPAPSCVR